MYEQIKVYFYQYLFNSRCFKFARSNSQQKKCQLEGWHWKTVKKNRNIERARSLMNI